MSAHIGQLLSQSEHDDEAAIAETSCDHAHGLRTPMIVPDFWTGVPPLDQSAYTIDCRALALRAEDLSAGGMLPEELLRAMRTTFDKFGLVLLRNTGLGSNKAGANARRPIASNVFETGAPGAAHLHYHHEMAYVSKSVRAIAFCCAAALPDDGTHRGAMFVSEAQGHTDTIMRTDLGHKLKERGITYIRCLTDRDNGESDDPNDEQSGVYNHWQTSFGVETPEEAEAIARSRGLEVEWGSKRYMKTKYTTSAFEYCHQLDRNLLYGSVADDSVWFDTWPGVKQLPTMASFSTATPSQRPLKITFGDGTDFTRQELQTFVRVYDMHGLPLDWCQGDVAVVCNHRWAHGRPAFNLARGEERTLGVVLGEMYQREGQREGKWAAQTAKM
eukprot:TRINITY_DN32919_c0_g1_i1.p1 TRINITY_DN32919_c0_g1~~TRINITY_DN32919_c0_g1_i1.p1  ORF type:complete len:412 (-),score=69.49 TRINITY_DN32919_c0_g1_i1:328-1488(-)